jgi:hypothetical protein
MLEVNRIEKYDIAQDYFEELNIKLPNPVYGCFATMVNESKILIGGGWTEEKGNSSITYSLDISSGKCNYLKDIPAACWTILPVFYKYGNLHIFSIGEETDGKPDHHAYPVQIPF